MKYEKLLHSILYILKKANRENLGKVKLAKILFFADVLYYLQHGSGFLKVRFQKLPNGPVPKSFDKHLYNWAGEYFAMFDSEYYGYTKTQFQLLSDHHPDLSLLQPEEIESLEKAIRKLENKSATEVSEFSHEILPWESIPLYDDIPLKLATFAYCEPIQEEGGSSLLGESILENLEFLVNE